MIAVEFDTIQVILAQASEIYGPRNMTTRMMRDCVYGQRPLRPHEEVLKALGVCPLCSSQLGTVTATVQNKRLHVIFPYCECGYRGAPYGEPA